MNARSSQLVCLLAGSLVALVLGASACGQPSEVRHDETANVPTENLTGQALECDDHLDPDAYLAEYIDTESFRALHPSFDRWKLLFQPDAAWDTCLVDGFGRLTIWSFELPAELSRFAVPYTYGVYLTITPERTATLARTERPEDLIATAEAVPAVAEFFEKREPLTTGELRDRIFIAARSYAQDGSRVSPLTVHYWSHSVGWLDVSGAGWVQSANLDPSEQWESFPSLPIGNQLVSDVLDGGPCKLREPTMAHLGPSWEGFQTVTGLSRSTQVAKGFSVECEDSERGAYEPRQHLSVQMNSITGEYVVWWPAGGSDRQQVASGTMTAQQLDAIKRSPFVVEGWELSY